ncbi:Gfo/Idh/MocA family protein [Halomarina halobia]|uniref:Gfo/Idh/MocA family protein n=1 Tax=Halomarina halobia TaxID=3033386 RepID=A0ABD6A9H0_9EURY|nr:Gfo/Idh/MocA family oxidoreductase [Halomarina sp. PSR21]
MNTSTNKTTSAPPRVGLIGLGSIGHIHAEHLQSLATEGVVELAGGMDISSEACERFENRFGVRAYEYPEELYETVDAVIVATPNRFHEEYAVDAFEAGLDVFLEKPLAHNLQSAERIADAAHAAEGIGMVGFLNRFNDAVRVFKHYQRQGRFGEVTHVEANYVRRRGVPGRGSWFTDKAVSGGGALVDIGVHAIDLALHLLSFPEVRELTGVTRSQFGHQEDYTYLEMWGEDGEGVFDVDDSASAFIRCAEDRTVSLEVAWATNRPPTTEFVVHGTEGGATLDLDGNLTIYEASSGGAPHFEDTEVATQRLPAMRSELRAFLAAVASDEPPTQNTVDEALVVQRVLDGIYRSAETGTAVSLHETPISASD